MDDAGRTTSNDMKPHQEQELNSIFSWNDMQPGLRLDDGLRITELQRYGLMYRQLGKAMLDNGFRFSDCQG